MNTSHRFFVAGLLTSLSLVYASTVLAESQYQQQQYSPQYQQPRQKSYGEKVGDKALNGITNIATSGFEIPKNIINTMNDEEGNLVYGFVGGGLKGVLHMLSRAASGSADLLTAPLATKPIASPKYIWEDFDEDTTYGNVFRLDNNNQQPPAQPNPYMR